MCAACSPGGRSFTLSLIVTPDPPLPPVSVAAASLWALASLRSTVAGLLAAHTTATPKRLATTTVKGWLIILYSPLMKWSHESRLYTQAASFEFVTLNRDRGLPLVGT